MAAAKLKKKKMYKRTQLNIIFFILPQQGQIYLFKWDDFECSSAQKY